MEQVLGILLCCTRAPTRAARDLAAEPEAFGLEAIKAVFQGLAGRKRHDLGWPCDCSSTCHAPYCSETVPSAVCSVASAPTGDLRWVRLAGDGGGEGGEPLAHFSSSLGSLNSWIPELFCKVPIP